MIWLAGLNDIRQCMSSSDNKNNIKKDTFNLQQRGSLKSDHLKFQNINYPK